MLTAAEYLMDERPLLSEIQGAVLDLCRSRRDVVLFGAQAVNVYVATPRMSQDVDLLAEDAEGLANDILRMLHARFHIAVRIGVVASGRGMRLYQVRKPANRHLVDVRARDVDLDVTSRKGLRVPTPAYLVAMKLAAYAKRRSSPKGGTDLADIRRMLLAFPDLRKRRGAVAAALDAIGAGRAAKSSWTQIQAAKLVADEDADEGY
jgi:nucleotidyltransferase AbiEii toxin of type IV toxin-antitoxin system